MLWVVATAAVAVVVLGALVVRSHQRFGRQRSLVQEAWRQVEVELGRRHELITELVEAVRDVPPPSEQATTEEPTPTSAASERPDRSDPAEHPGRPEYTSAIGSDIEYAAFDRIERLRSAAGARLPELAQRAEVEAELSEALSELFAVVDAHPRVRTDHAFLAAQQRIAETEGRIAAGRRFYNANVAAYNTRVERFPSRVIASRASFAKGDYFELDDARIQVTPQVDLAGLDAVAGLDEESDVAGSPTPDEQERPGQNPTEQNPTGQNPTGQNPTGQNPTEQSSSEQGGAGNAPTGQGSRPERERR